MKKLDKYFNFIIFVEELLEMDNQQRNFNFKKQEIIDLYLQGVSANQLSKMYSKNISSIVFMLRKNNIQIRTVKEGLNLKLNLNNKNRENLVFTKEQIEFIKGLLCGDGCLRLVRRGKYPYYTHTDKNKEYVNYLIDYFKTIKVKCSDIWINEKSGCFCFQTETLKAFETLYNIFYKTSSKKIVKDILITPTILKNWYIGDGNVKKCTGSKNIATEITCKWYCPFIEKQFKVLFGEECKYHKSSQKYYFPVKYRNNFIDYIGSNSVGCYNYKFLKN